MRGPPRRAGARAETRATGTDVIAVTDDLTSEVAVHIDAARTLAGYAVVSPLDPAEALIGVAA